MFLLQLFKLTVGGAAMAPKPLVDTPRRWPSMDPPAMWRPLVVVCWEEGPLFWVLVVFVLVQ